MLQSQSLSARAYWEQVHPPLAHITYRNGLHGSEAMLTARWDSNWLRRWSRGGPPFHVKLNGSRVGDYGIGAGLLGKLLCARHRIVQYVGFDVANRSLSAASALLAATVPQCAARFELVGGAVPEFCRYQLDVLVSQQV